MAVSVEESGQELKLGTPHALFKALGIGYRLGVYAASADGQRFLVNGDPPTVSKRPPHTIVELARSIEEVGIEA